MRGDFSRISFNRLKHYTAVLEQQGRVALDADANEQCFIDEYMRGIETLDVIGEYGAPVDDAGFEITVAGTEIMIGAGRYYVGGLICENPTKLSYDQQPFLLAARPSATDLLTELVAAPDGTVIQVYLEAWQRLVTALDDPCLREPALGQADTTARIQTVWRVVASLESRELLPSTPPAGIAARMAPCCQVMYAPKTIDFPDLQLGGKMRANVNGSTAECGCQPVAQAGYVGVENQLYRVEIHQGGDAETATFKWSRENGSVASAVTAISGSTVTVDTLGPDANLGFQDSHWVELSDDTNLFGETPNQPGNLYQVQSTKQSDPSVTLVGTVAPVDPAQHARLRRWDQTGPAATPNGIPLSPGTPIPLESGIEVCFSDGLYAPGDYWMIPARTATGTIEWPPCGSDEAYQPPSSIQIFRAPLACIHWEPGLRFPVRNVGTVETAAEATPQAPADTEAQGETEQRTSQLPLSEVRLLSDAELLKRGHFTWDDCRMLFNPLAALTAPATAPAIHVEGMSWENDGVMTLDQLIANGLAVKLDAAPTSPISGANFVVTIEAVTFGQEFVKAETGQQIDQLRSFATATRLGIPTTLRTITVVDSQITVDGESVSWQLPYESDSIFQNRLLEELEQLLSPGALIGRFARARVKLLGEMIYVSSTGGTQYLDGRAFGENALGLLGQPETITLKLPSGEGSTASDFESWFSLAPTLAIESITMNDPAFTVEVNSQNQVTGVQTAPAAGDIPQTVTPTATILLNYRPVAAGTITLILSGTSGVGTVVSVPGTVQITPGQQQIDVEISVLSNPGAGQTLTFDLGAYLTPAAGSGSDAGTSFTLTGAPAPFQ